MSQLYIRVKTGFYTHRKTVRLFSKLGPDAFWIPPRLWAYCAENQPDGDLSGYSAEEIAMLVAYKGDACCMLVALKDCGFITSEGHIHDWMEHNGYHKKYSERAKTAAAARWNKKERKEPKERKSTEKEERGKGSKHCLSIASSIRTFTINDLGELKTPLNTPEFAKSWGEWVSYRMKLRGVKDWKDMFTRQLNDLANYDSTTATAMLNQSMRNGWQGIFQIKNYGTHPSNPKENARNRHTIKGTTDYAALGKLQLERQKAARQAELDEQMAPHAPPPPAIGGNGA